MRNYLPLRRDDFYLRKIVDKKYVTYYIIYIGNILHILMRYFYELR